MFKIIITILLGIQISFLNAQNLESVYILSEGGINLGTSKLSKLNIGSGEFTQSIFSPGSIGLFPDGLIQYSNNLYLTSQGSFGGAGTIYKLDLEGNLELSKEVGLNPYNLTASNSKIYITNGPINSVVVLNDATLNKVGEIEVGVYPQEIIAFNDYVFVANTSQWGGEIDSTVSVINSITDEVINSITVKPNPSSMVITNDEFLLIGCPGDGDKGIIYKIELNEFTKVDSFLIEQYGFDKDLSIDRNSNMIFFKSYSNKIIKLNPDTKETAVAVDDTENIFIYGYAYDYEHELHYIADAKDFASNGILRLYDNNGSSLGSFETGIAPRRIVMKYNDEMVSVENPKIVQKYNLWQNYPNPFNPSTIIRYSVSKNLTSNSSGNQKVQIKVYDILGNEVETLVDENKPVGTYELEFDGSELTSGVYYYKLITEHHSEIKKMILVK